MATTSSWRKRVEKGLPQDNYGDSKHSEAVESGISACGNVSRAAGRRLRMNDNDDDAMSDEADDEDDV